MAVSRIYRDYQESLTSLSTYTYTNMAIGPASASRFVACALFVRGTGNNPGAAIDTATIGGIAADVVVQQTNAATNWNLCAIIMAQVPTGTTADIVINLNQSGIRSACTTYSIEGVADTTAFATAANTGSPPTMNINIEADGAAISCGTQSGNTTTTVVGLTEDYDTNPGFSTFAGGSDEFATPQTPLNVIIQFAGNDAEPCGVTASWSPGDPGPGPGPAIAPLAMHHQRQQR